MYDFIEDQLKILASIFLTSVIFIQTFSTYFIKADFYLNQSYITKNLCVNREKPNALQWQMLSFKKDY